MSPDREDNGAGDFNITDAPPRIHSIGREFSLDGASNRGRLDFFSRS
jgi:hypothetical protein